MQRHIATFLFGAAFALGLVLELTVRFTNNYSVMQGYAIFLSLCSITVILMRLRRDGVNALLSCYSAVIAAPIWFLYLEAIFRSGDAWQLQAGSVILALALSPLFLLVFHLMFFARPPAAVARFHDRHFLKQIPSSFLPTVGIVLTCLTFVSVLLRYGFDWDYVKMVYLAGRAGGTGLIRRGGIGGWEVFLQPLDFMASSVPTIAAMSWVQIGRVAKASLQARIGVSICAAFLIFVMFLGGSRGLMAGYLVGPVAIWLIFGRRVGNMTFTIASLLMFSLLIGVWEYQVRKRNYLLQDLRGVSDFAGKTTFNVANAHRDNNLYLLTLERMYRPSPHPYAGYKELFYLAVNPIPRALWRGKPKGIQESQASFEEPVGPAAMGPIRMGTASLSCSVVGDGVRMAGVMGVAMWGIIFGLLGSMWDRIGQKNMFGSPLFFILNAAWVFWFLWGFRSSFAFVTGMYPVWGAYVLCLVAARLSKAVPHTDELLELAPMPLAKAALPALHSLPRGRSAYAEYLHGFKS